MLGNITICPPLPPARTDQDNWLTYGPEMDLLFTGNIQRGVNLAFMTGGPDFVLSGYDVDIMGGNVGIGGAVATGRNLSFPPCQGKRVSMRSVFLDNVTFGSAMMAYFDARGCQFGHALLQPNGPVPRDQLNTLIDSEYLFGSIGSGGLSIDPSAAPISDLTVTVREIGYAAAGAVTIFSPGADLAFIGARVTADHIHDAAPNTTLVRIGDGPPAGRFGMNRYEFSMRGRDVNNQPTIIGVETYGSGDHFELRCFNFDNDLKPAVVLHPGAIDNTVNIRYFGNAVPTIRDWNPLGMNIVYANGARIK